MKNIYYTISTTMLLFAFLFCIVSCERPEIKPEQSESLETASVTSISDWLVGTWVRYWDSSDKDTLRFSDNGTLEYSLCDFPNYGLLYTMNYFYECTDNYLISYFDLSDYYHIPNYIEFTEDHTVILLHNFIFHPGSVEGTMSYDVYFKKID